MILLFIILRIKEGLTCIILAMLMSAKIIGWIAETKRIPIDLTEQEWKLIKYKQIKQKSCISGIPKIYETYFK